MEAFINPIGGVNRGLRGKQITYSLAKSKKEEKKIQRNLFASVGLRKRRAVGAGVGRHRWWSSRPLRSRHRSPLTYQRQSAVPCLKKRKAKMTTQVGVHLHQNLQHITDKTSKVTGSSLPFLQSLQHRGKLHRAHKTVSTVLH